MIKLVHNSPHRRDCPCLFREAGWLGDVSHGEPRLSARQQRELVRMAGAGEFTIADLAEVFTVSRATVYRTLQRNQPAQPRPAGRTVPSTAKPPTTPAPT